MELRLVNPRGFCAGVERAVSIVDELLDADRGPVYVRHEIVHNHAVVDGLRRRGAVFVDELAEIPPGALAVVSAHGAPQSVTTEARARGLRLFDATCPLVTKVQLQVMRLAREGQGVIVVGHRGHPEVIGLLGHYDRRQGPGIVVVENQAEARCVQPPHPDRLGFVTQTTLSVDEAGRIADVLRERFPGIVGPRTSDICYATQNRQQAVTELAASCEVVLVVGAPHSSNSLRLREIAERAGARAHLIESAAAISPDWLVDCQCVGLTASASAPEHLVQGVVERLRALSPGLKVSETGEKERMVFRPPPELQVLRNENRVPPVGRVSASREGEGVSGHKAADPVGLEDVVRSVRELARNARKLVEEAGGVAERELAMVMTAGEETRNRLVSAESLEEARAQPLLKALRADAHRAVDLGFDAVAVAYVTTVAVVERFLDQPRKALAAAG